MKHFFTLCLLAVSMCAVAQEQTQAKRIAILETVDKMDGVPYGIKLQLRQSLTFSITQTPGYEGYSRVDMSSITGEQNFQRTGMVKDEDIKRLGEMTGAAYVLIAEAAPYDDNHIIITANLINVETARVEKATPPKVSKKAPEDMGNACALIANALLKGNVSDINSVQHSDSLESNQEMSQTANQNTQQDNDQSTTQHERDIEKIKIVPIPVAAVNIYTIKNNGFTFFLQLYHFIRGATCEWYFIDKNTQQQISEIERITNNGFSYYDIWNMTRQDVENTYVKVIIKKEGYEDAIVVSPILYYGNINKSTTICAYIDARMKKIK